MSLADLQEALAAQGGTLAALLGGDLTTGTDGGGHRGNHGHRDGALGHRDGALGQAPGLGAPQLAARGPRTAADPAEYELLLEMILEGSLLHYGRARVVLTDDRDLELLLGDQLYALGLARLAELGDLDAVQELADIISLLSQAELDGDAALARAIWQAGAVAIGWGATPEHEAAKALARIGDASALPALVECAGRPRKARPVAHPG